MDKEFKNFSPYQDFNNTSRLNDYNPIYSDHMFNPITQYEQTAAYYRCLSSQIDYKIKCKEYDILCEQYNIEKNRNIDKTVR